MDRPFFLSVVILIGMLISYSASAEIICQNLPASKLRVLSAEPSEMDDYAITPEEMDRIAAEAGVPSTERRVHPLMLMAAVVDAHVAVQHRVVEVKDGEGLAYCDAPTSVEISFGVVSRKVFILRQAASDSCVRGVLLEHYAEHSAALDEQVRLFVNERRENLGMRLRKLKQTAATDAVTAKKTFEAGLWSLLRDFLKDFKEERVHTRPGSGHEIDSIENLNKLRDACAGKIHEMEKKLTVPESNNEHSNNI